MSFFLYFFFIYIPTKHCTSTSFAFFIILLSCYYIDNFNTDIVGGVPLKLSIYRLEIPPCRIMPNKIREEFCNLA